MWIVLIFTEFEFPLQISEQVRLLWMCKYLSLREIVIL